MIADPEHLLTDCTLATASEGLSITEGTSVKVQKPTQEELGNLKILEKA